MLKNEEEVTVRGGSDYEKEVQLGAKRAYRGGKIAGQTGLQQGRFRLTSTDMEFEMGNFL